MNAAVISRGKTTLGTSAVSDVENACGDNREGRVAVSQTRIWTGMSPRPLVAVVMMSFARVRSKAGWKTVTFARAGAWIAAVP